MKLTTEQMLWLQQNQEKFIIDNNNYWDIFDEDMWEYDDPCPHEPDLNLYELFKYIESL